MNSNGCNQPLSQNVFVSQEQFTVGEVLDQRIQQAREEVEKLCVNKAKLEALNMLQLPYVKIVGMLQGY